MPELPEVETVKKVLQKWCLNMRIDAVDVFYPKIIKSSNFADIVGQKINAIDRVGKWLIFSLDKGFLLSHLRMEGKYFWRKDQNYNKHDLIIFSFQDSDYQLIYNDSRRFGCMYYVFDLATSPLASLGLDPLNLNETALAKLLKEYKGPLKSFLLDQSKIAGIGNIYADEIAFKIKAHPTKLTAKLNKKEIKELTLAIKEILLLAIEAGGSTVNSFHFNGDGSGLFQHQLKVYGRKNQKCFICNNVIQKFKFKGRGTHFCPNCQEEK